MELRETTPNQWVIEIGVHHTHMNIIYKDDVNDVRRKRKQKIKIQTYIYIFCAMIMKGDTLSNNAFVSYTHAMHIMHVLV